MSKRQLTKRQPKRDSGVLKKTQQVRVVNTIADELKMNAGNNYQLRTGLMNYIRCVYGNYVKGDLITLSKNDGRNLSTTTSYNIEIEIKHENAREIELLLNPDYLITTDFQKIWSDEYFDNECKFSVGLVFMNGQIYDIMVDAIDIKEAVKYRLLSSKIELDAKSYFKMVKLNAEPRIIFKHKDTQFANVKGACFPTAITNYNCFNEARVVGPDLRESDKLHVCFTTKEFDMDKIGYFDKISPIITGGYDNTNNVPDNISFISNNIVNSQTDVKQVEDRFKNVKIAIEAYKLWVESFSVLRTKLHSKRKFLYAKILTPKNVPSLTLRMTSIYQILTDEYASNVYRNNITPYQFSIARDLRRLRDILYFQEINDLRTTFGEENGIYNVNLNQKERKFIERLNAPSNRNYKLKLLSVLYKL